MGVTPSFLPFRGEIYRFFGFSRKDHSEKIVIMTKRFE